MLLNFGLTVLLYVAFEPRGAEFQLEQRIPWISELGHQLPRGRRRPGGLADAADRVPRAAGGAGSAGRFIDTPGEGVPPRPADAPDRDARRAGGAGHHPLLRLLRGDAHPDVPAHRGVGLGGPADGGDEVLPLHPGRLAADAGGDPRGVLPRPAVGGAQLRLRHHLQLARSRPTASSPPAWRRNGAAPACRRWPARCRSTGPGCSWPSPLAFAIKVPMFPLHTWLPDAHVQAPVAGSIDPRRGDAEDGHLRLLALRHPALPGGGAADALGARGAGGGGHRLRRADVPRPAGHQEAHRLQLGEPPGLLHAGHAWPSPPRAPPAAPTRC